MLAACTVCTAPKLQHFILYTTFSLYAAPLAPTNLASPSQSPTSITLSWEQPAGANVDSYTITFDYQGECSDFNLATDFRFSVNGNVTEFTMRDLQEFSSYVITVTAVNSGGSNTSEVLTVNTTSAGMVYNNYYSMYI